MLKEISKNMEKGNGVHKINYLKDCQKIVQKLSRLEKKKPIIYDHQETPVIAQTNKVL